MGAELCYDQIIEFESDCITVDIPTEGIYLEGLCKILPLTYPMVSFTKFDLVSVYTDHLQVLKREVDRYRVGRALPKCTFLVIPLEKGKDIPSVQHQVQLSGAKFPHNLLTFDIKPPKITSGEHVILVYIL